MKQFFAVVGGVVAIAATTSGTLWWVGTILEQWCPCQSSQLAVAGMGAIFTLGGIGAAVTCLREENRL